MSYRRTITITEVIPDEEVEEASKEFPLLMEGAAITESAKLLKEGIEDDFPGATVSVIVQVVP